MVLRTCISLLIGAVCGALLGATSFAVSEYFFGRGMFFGKSPVLAAILGAICAGVPSLLVGAVVGGFRLSKIYSATTGLIAGLMLVLYFVVRSETKYFHASGYFDKQMFYYDLIVNASLLLSPCLAALIVSASVNELFAPGK